MANITMESAIASRDIIAEPYYIVKEILYKEGMELYADIACERILKFMDDNLDYHEYIHLNFLNSNIEVPLFGFLIIKSILLSYISEETYQEYLYALRLKNEQVQAWNGMIVFLRELSRKKLYKLRRDIKASLIEKDKERLLELVQCELKARSFLNGIRNRFYILKLRVSFRVRVSEIIRSIKRKSIYAK